MIQIVVYRRQASVERGPYTSKLLSRQVEAIPRPGDFILIQSGAASLLVDRVDFNYTTTPTTVEVYVK